MSERRFWFEEVPEDEQYWFLAQWDTLPSAEAAREAETAPGAYEEQSTGYMHERMRAVRYQPQALREPWGSAQVYSWEHEAEGGGGRSLAPIFFTTREQAEKEERELETEEAEGYLDLVGRMGEARAGNAFNNSLPYRALWVNLEMLLNKLEDADFPYVVVDGAVTLRGDFIEQLRGQGEGRP